MTKHWLGIAAAVALIAAALPANAAPERAGGGGGGGGHAGGGGGAAHVSSGHFGGGGARFGGGGAVRSGGARSTGHFAVSHTRSRAAVTGRSKIGKVGSASRVGAATTHARSTAAARRDATRTKAATLRQNRAATRANAVTLRQNRAARLATAHQGRFASRFYGNAARARVAFRPNRWAWRHGWRAGFVGWYGPLFWPYAYADVFGYAFWPWGYAPGYWDYAYDDFLDGVFYGDAGYAPGDAAPQRTASAAVSYTSVAQLCKQPGEGVTAFPFSQITSKVQLTDAQKPLFDDFQTSAKKAADTFAAACPANNAFSLTAPGRLQSITARLQATDEAVQTVKPALDKFYASLSDDQKERFNALGPKQDNKAVAANAAATTTGSAVDEKQACGEAKPGLTNLPIQQIQDTVKPTDAQQAELKDLQDAAGKAVSQLQATCPTEAALTPPGRLDAMDQHLKAMIEAANTVKPALDKFYAALTDEQKARFDRLGSQLSQND